MRHHTQKELRAIHAKNQSPFYRRHYVPKDKNEKPTNCVMCGTHSLSVTRHGGICSKKCQEQLIRGASYPYSIKTRFGVNARTLGVR